MFAGYVKVRNMLEVYERGLVEWDDEAKEFRKLVTFAGLPTVHPRVTAL
jgi:hypothetical protein